MRSQALRAALLLALALTLLAGSGCSALPAIRGAFVYSCDRVVDTGDMLDFGITFSGKRCYSLYACGLGLFTVGGSYFDGYFVGIGGSRIGAFRHYNKMIGLVAYNYEEMGWGTFDKNDRETLSRRHGGLIGWLFFPRQTECRGPT